MPAADAFVSRGTFCDWGPAGARRSSLWGTAQARSVLEAAGRM